MFFFLRFFLKKLLRIVSNVENKITLKHYFFVISMHEGAAPNRPVIDSCIFKSGTKERNFRGWVRVEDLWLRVLNSWMSQQRRSRKHVLVSIGHSDKRLDRSVGSILIQFVSEGLLSIRKNKEDIRGGDYGLKQQKQRPQ